MDLQLTGKTALITGGSGGIGSAIAATLLREGVSVAITTRSPDAVAASRSGFFVTRGDTSSLDDVHRMVGEVVDAIGDIDILVNCAATPGYVSPTPALDSVDFAAAAADLDVKVLGYLRSAQAVAPGMRDRGWGRIISVAGLAARRTGSIVGSVRNAGVVALTKNLADELGSYGVNVTAVHPGPTVSATGVPPNVDAAARISIGRCVTADEVADVVAFLASPRSVAINGEVVSVGGGDRGSIHY